LNSKEKYKREWTLTSDVLPDEYMMCFLITEEGKQKMGWRSGKNFDGLHVTEEDKIIKWKKTFSS